MISIIRWDERSKFLLITLRVWVGESRVVRIIPLPRFREPSFFMTDGVNLKDNPNTDGSQSLEFATQIIFMDDDFVYIFTLH